MMVEEVREHLENVIIPFWKKLRDDVFGGYYGLLDYDLYLDKKAVKGCILNSRILWFFSNAYKTLGDKSLLREADHAFEFLIKYCIDKIHGGVFWSMYYNGTPMDTTKYTYNQAFAIYALASYYDVSQNAEALRMAFDIYHIIENKCRDEVGYLESFDEEYNLIPNEQLSENGVIADKTMNTLLHVFEAYTELFRVTRNKEVEEKIKNILDLFAEKVYNPKLHRQEVFFDQQLNSIIDLHSYGHDIETAWLIDRGISILRNPEYEAKMKPITKALVEEIYKTAFDGHALNNECVNGEVDTTRIWWVQAETVIGFLNGYEQNPEKKEYLEAAKQEWDYIKETIWDKRSGSEWFSEVDITGEPTSKKPIVEPWKCPYHNGRMCIEVIRRSYLFR